MSKSLDKVQVGKRIREARESLHLSREALAAQIPMSPSFLADVEGGTKKLSLEKFNRVVYELDVSADYILFGRRELANPDESRAIIFERINGDLSQCDTEKLSYLADAIRSIVAATTTEDDEKKPESKPGNI